MIFYESESTMPLPGNKIVISKARETPSNESSDVLIEHRLHIAARSQDGDDITWAINKLTFRQTGGDKWTDADPGLNDWVVTHADPAAPVASDFNSPPNMSGTANNEVVSGDDLTYGLTPGTCTFTEKTMYGGDVTCAEYSYVAGSETLAEEDEDEPAETEFEGDPS